MEKVVFELDLGGFWARRRGGGWWGGEKRTFPHTESSNSKAAESGNMDVEKQTVQSGWGVECMKGIRKAAVVLGTHRQPASNKWRVNQPFHSAEGEAPSEAVALASPQAGFSSFSFCSRCFISLCSFPREIKGQLPNIKGSINPGCNRRLQFSKSCHHLEQKHCRGSFKSSNCHFPFFRMARIAFPSLPIFSTFWYSLCPQRIKPDFHLFCL